jgi:tRNA U34 2-thiouridine synthase MnmA/TrmU
LYKAEVKAIAQAHPRLSQCVEVLSKKESMGLCFVGKRQESFGSFLSKYIDLTPGRFIDASTGAVLGTHEGSQGFTIGQKANIHSQKHKYYVVSKGAVPGLSLEPGDVLVAEGRAHPLLFTDRVVVDLSRFQWSFVSDANTGRIPTYIVAPIIAHLQQAQLGESTVSPGDRVPLVLPHHGQDIQSGAHRLLDAGALLEKYFPGFEPLSYERREPLAAVSQLSYSIVFHQSITPTNLKSASVVVHGLSGMHRYRGDLARCTLHFDVKCPEGERVWELASHNELDVRFESPQRAVTAGQILALYDGEYLVGGGTILQ